MMKTGLRLQARRCLPLALLLLFAAVIVVRKEPERGQPADTGRNPQEFFLWATNSSFSYSFRYDPRAADEWLFHSGAWLFAASPPPGTAPTNSWPTSSPPK
jgi:hypothetical protein